MTRLARGYDYNNNGGVMGEIVGGVNAGLGIASTMGQLQNQKLQKEAYKREAGEFDRLAPEREAASELNKAKTANDLFAEQIKGSDMEGNVRMVTGQLISATAENAATNPDGLSIDAHNQRMSEVYKTATAGRGAFSSRPVKMEDGTMGYEGTFSLKGGITRTGIYRDGKGLSELATQHRLSDLYAPSVGERQAQLFADSEGKRIFGELTEEQKKAHGIPAKLEDAMKDGKFKAFALNAIRENKGGGAQSDAWAEEGRKVDDQGMQVEKHKSDLAVNNEQIQTANIHQASLAQGMAFAQTNQAQIEKIDAYELTAKRYAAAGDTAKVVGVIRDTAQELISSLQPTIEKVEATDLAPASTKATHTPAQSKMLDDISRTATALIEADNRITVPQAIEMVVKKRKEEAQAEADELARKAEAERLKVEAAAKGPQHVVRGKVVEKPEPPVTRRLGANTANALSDDTKRWEESGLGIQQVVKKLDPRTPFGSR